MSNYIKLLNNLEELNLTKMRDFLPNYLSAKQGTDILLADALFELTETELEFRNERASKMQIHVSGFPFEKTIKDFNFSFQPSINKKNILELESLRFIEEKENIILVGSCGVGKTHLAVALGIAAAKKRNSVYFVSCHDLILNLKKAHSENRLESRLKHYSKFSLLIIDEIGYLPLDKLSSNLLFQLITKRYEKNSTIVTTNQVFSQWGELFSDSTVANAMLDRLLHHSHIIKITGPSYRLKEKFEDLESEKK